MTVPRHPPTICQLLHTLQVGGAEMLAARLARQMRDSFRFLFVCLDGLGTLGEQLRAEGFPVEVLNRRPGLDGRCTWRLARLLRREGVELIHAHQYTPFSYALLARLLYRRPPILFQEHGRHFPDFPRRKRMWFNRLMMQKRDRAIGVGEAVRQALIANEGLPAARIGVIYNGIDPARFANTKSERDAVRRELDLQPSDLVLMQVARLDYLKDHATAFRTVQQVARQRHNVRLLLAGEGPEREKLQALVAESNLGQHVRFLGLRTDVARLLAAADLFLLTSISEGIPLTLIEAMAAGVVVVSTDVGGVREVVLHEETGLLAPSGDAAGLAAATLHLADDAHLRQSMEAKGRERARALFSEAQMHAAYRELYREMLHLGANC